MEIWKKLWVGVFFLNTVYIYYSLHKQRHVHHWECSISLSRTTYMTMWPVSSKFRLVCPDSIGHTVCSASPESLWSTTTVINRSAHSTLCIASCGKNQYYTLHSMCYQNKNNISHFSFLLLFFCFYSCRWWSVFRILYSTHSEAIRTNNQEDQLPTTTHTMLLQMS